MTQEEKLLLLKDLSARLPYGVKVTTTNPAVKIGVILGISIKNKISVETKDADIVFDCTEVKPYLRPMLSMTKEEYEELRKIDKYYGIAPLSEINDWEPGYKSIDWLNSHHFDYRVLIKKDLAIEVTEENNPYNLDLL